MYFQIQNSCCYILLHEELKLRRKHNSNPTIPERIFANWKKHWNVQRQRTRRIGKMLIAKPPSGHYELPSLFKLLHATWTNVGTSRWYQCFSRLQYMRVLVDASKLLSDVIFITICMLYEAVKKEFSKESFMGPTKKIAYRNLHRPLHTEQSHASFFK